MNLSFTAAQLVAFLVLVFMVGPALMVVGAVLTRLKAIEKRHAEEDQTRESFVARMAKLEFETEETNEHRKQIRTQLHTHSALLQNLSAKIELQLGGPGITGELTRTLARIEERLMRVENLQRNGTEHS